VIPFWSELVHVQCHHILRTLGNTQLASFAVQFVDFNPSLDGHCGASFARCSSKIGQKFSTLDYQGDGWILVVYTVTLRQIQKSFYQAANSRKGAQIRENRGNSVDICEYPVYNSARTSPAEGLLGYRYVSPTSPHTGAAEERFRQQARAVRRSEDWRRKKMKYAIVEDGGKQYRAVEGGTIEVDLYPSEVGEQIDLERVLMIADGDQYLIGAPLVTGARVQATVVGQVKGPKVVVFKYKPKKRYRVKTGHRQKYTRLKIDAILVDTE
jgi:large subunit ribosomal protein L21